ncbi:PH domain-containing protein [Staphylococcus intermedius]|uniref:PH domain-containing protein n=1 Tax=Staphylococcus intermedius TaxID=1285 RepID=UPI000BBC6ECE|nr:PH domain-containing protein [Staphylococcus intermedius]PCF84090.1 hypothetical protein B4W76_12325 [Staphylococcus intermedius]
METLPIPNLKLSKNVVKLWVVSHFITHSITLISTFLLLFLSIHYEWYEIVKIIFIIIIFLVLISFFAELLFILKFKYDLFRFSISGDFLQIKKGGILYNQHIVVYIKDIYFFDIYQNPLMKKYDLYTLKFKTVAYTHEIAGISSSRVNEYLNYLSENKVLDEEEEK